MGEGEEAKDVMGGGVKWRSGEGRQHGEEWRRLYNTLWGFLGRKYGCSVMRVHDSCNAVKSILYGEAVG